MLVSSQLSAFSWWVQAHNTKKQEEEKLKTLFQFLWCVLYKITNTLVGLVKVSQATMRNKKKHQCNCVRHRKNNIKMLVVIRALERDGVSVVYVKLAPRLAPNWTEQILSRRTVFVSNCKLHIIICKFVEKNSVQN